MSLDIIGLNADPQDLILIEIEVPQHLPAATNADQHSSSESGFDVPQEPEHIHEIRLAGRIRPNDDVEWTQLDFELVEALEVLDCEFGDRHRISPIAGITLAVVG